MEYVYAQAVTKNLTKRTVFSEVFGTKIEVVCLTGLNINLYGKIVPINLSEANKIINFAYLKFITNHLKD